MKRLIPHSSSSNLRVFTSCLLSFLFVMTPLATLAASMKATAVSRSSRSETDAAKAEKLFKTEQPVVTAQENNSALARIFASFLPPAVTTVTATKVDSFAAGDDVDNDGKADPGDKITYNVTISDSGADATGVTFTDTIDSHTTLVPNSLNISPLAGNDSYETIANTLLEVGPVGSPSSRPKVTVTGSVFDNDTEFLGDTFTLKSLQAVNFVSGTVTATSANGGTVVMDGSGKFSFTPKEGSTSNDTFTYTITDKGADGIAGNADDLTSTATVTITVKSPRIWYVDNTAGAGGKGRSTDPFNTLAAAQTVANAAGDIIYVFTGSGATTNQNAGFTFQAANQQLLGEGVALQPTVTVNGVVNPTLRAAGTAPHIGNSGGNGVTVGNFSGIIIRGLNSAGSTNGVGVTFSAAGGGVTISNNTLSGTSANGVDVTTSGVGGGSATISNNTISGAGVEGIDINGQGSGGLTVDVSSNAVTSTGNGIDINGVGGGTLNITNFASNAVSGASGANGIIVNTAKFDAVVGGNLDTVSGGTTVIGSAGAGNGVGGNGLVLINTTGNLSFTDLDIFADGGFGLQVSGTGVLTATTGTGIAVGSGVGSITTTAGSAIDIQAATIDLQQLAVTSSGGTDGVSLTNGDAGTFSSTSGSTIAGASGDDFVVGSGTANITWNGVLNGSTGHTVNVTGHTGGTVAFTGAITDTGTGILLSSNGGTTINFSGGMTLNGASSVFSATGGATALNVTGTNTIGSTTPPTSTALNISNTTIGASGLTFRSISAGTASGTAGVGIILDTTGTSGGLTVTGNSSGQCGGAVTPNAVGTPATITAPNVADCTGGTIQHKGIAGTTTDFSTTDGNGIYLNNTSNVSLTRMHFNDFDNYAILGNNVTGFTLNNSNVSGLNGTNVNGVGEGDVYFTGLKTSATVSNSTFTGAATDAFHVFNNNGETLNRITITGSTFATNTAAGNQSGDAIGFQATNGTFNATVQSSAMTSARSDLFQLDIHGTVSSDLIFGGASASLGNSLTNNNANIVSGGGGVTISSGGAGDNANLTFNIRDNTMRDAVGTGLAISTGSGTSGFTGTVDGNQVGVPGVANSGSIQGDAFGFVWKGGKASDITITNNKFYQYGNGAGLLIQAGEGTSGGTQTLTTKVQGNTISNPGTFGSNGFLLNAGTASGPPADSMKVCLTLGGTAAGEPNILTGSGGGGATDIRLRQRFDVHVALIGTPAFNNGGNPQDATAVTNYVQPRNNGNGTPTVSVVSGNAGSGYFGTCGQLQFAMGGVMPYDGTSFSTFFNLSQLSTTGNLIAPTGIDFITWDTAAASTPERSEIAVTPAPLSVVTNSLSQQQLDTIVIAAIERWSATGLTQEQIATLHSIKFEVTDLFDSDLGEASDNHILVDRDASGKGWYVGADAQSDLLFNHVVSTTRRYTDPMSAPAGHLDLLTAIEHEMGHQLKLDDTYSESDRDNLMYGYLTAGERRLPAQAQAAGAESNKLSGTHFLTLSNSSGLPHVTNKRSAKGIRPSANKEFDATRLSHVTRTRAHAATSPLLPPVPDVNVSIGTLKVGQSVTVQFKVQLNAPPALDAADLTGTPHVRNQGSVTYTGGPGGGVLTDDPSVGGTSDPTDTPVDLYDSQTTIITSNNNTSQGEQVVFTATVINNQTPPPTVPGGTVPTGTVQFLDGATPITCNEGSTSTQTINGSGQATCTTSNLAVGAGKTIKAQYSGDGNFEATFGTVSQTVNACVMNPIVTTTVDDVNNTASLRYAVANVCTAPNNNVTFNLGAGAHTITLGSELVVGKNVNITNVVSAGNGALTISGNTSRVFNINSGKTVNINNLKITGGSLSSGGNGAGILNNGTLTLLNSTVSGNQITGGAGTNAGAGIANIGSGSILTIANSTISGNTTGGGTLEVGGGIYVSGTVSIINSTIANNLTNGAGSTNEGAGIFAEGTLNLANVTISGNSAINGSTNAGGGIYINGGTANAINSIISLNTATTSPDISGSLGVSTNNLIGTSAGQLQLGSLGNNGGPTQTMALAPSSVAIEGGTNVTTLNGAIDNVTTSVIVTDGTNIPAGIGFLIQIDNEQMSVTSKAGNTLTVVRGANATTAAPHNDLAPVNPAFDQRGTGFGRKRDAGSDADTTQTVDIGAFEADPSVEDIQDKTTAEDTPLSFIFHIGDAATSFDSVTATSSNTTLVPNANLTVGADTPSTRSLSITPAANEVGTSTITVTVTKTISGTVVSMSDTFVLTVTEVNDAPVPTNDTVSNIAEDSGIYTIPISTLLSNDTNKGAPNESGQTLTLTGVSNPTGGSVSNDATNVYFTPTADFNGAAGFDYTVTDNGTTNGNPDPKTGTAHVSFNITAVNDPPSFTKGTDQTVNEDAGAQTVNNWATAISPGGGADEAGQTLTFHVTNNTNTALFAVQPAVSSTGTLTYTPAANAFGTAAITLTLQDNGGTANGGQDTSAPQTFNITVNAVADTPSVTSASTFVNLQTSSGLVISRNGADGNEVGFFKITNIQNGTLFKNDGTTQITSGSFITFAEGNAGLKFTPTTDSTATGHFDVQGSIDNTGTGLSSAATATITVSKSGVTVTVTSSLNPSFANQTVTFTATVASATAYTGTPSGTVDFLENGNPIPGCSGANAISLSSGQAQCQTSSLSVSNHTISATYNGDAAFNSGSGNMTGNPQVVNPSLALTVNDTGDTPDNNIGDGICADINGKCTLRAAIQETNAIPSDDAITFDTAAGHAFDPATAPHTITLNDTNGALPAIDGNLTITGPGANTLTVQRSSLATSDIRIFAINSGKTVSISGLTISGGKVSAAGGGILNNGTLTLTDAVVSGNDISSGSRWGGGIFNGGTLIVTNTTVSGNTGGSGGTAGGGGIFNSGVLKLTNSTVSGNNAGPTGPGGGIYSTGSILTLVNVTVSGNTSVTNGGGIYNDSGAATLTNVTVTNNRSDNDNDTVGAGGGINVSGGTLTLHNTIVFGNFKGASPSTTPDDISGTVDAASSFNLIGTGGSGGLTNGTNNNQVGVTDARLGPLANNGGATKTHALLSGSPALDAGDNAVTGPPLNLTTDQRGLGFARSVDGPDADTTATVDIGAFEAQVSLVDIQDQTTNEDTQLQFTFNVNNGISSANVTATSSNQTIVPNANISVTGASSPLTLTINPAANQNTFASGPITITVTVTSGGQTMSDTFLLTVAPIADTPSVANSTTLEDTQSGAILVTKNAADGAEVSHFKVTGITNGTLFLNDGTTQITNGTFVPFASVGAGLKFTPAANLNSVGSAFSFTIQASTGNSDAGLGGSTATSTITVTAVNDAPSFTKGADQTVNEDAGAQTVNPWATAISAGPADESGQVLNFIVTNNNNGLFSTQPAVAANGTLTYTPAANANGSATVSVSLHDNGGTANNGQDTSAVQTFTITVNAVNDVPSFTKGADQTVFANVGAQTVNPWATSISAGPANESSQVVDFIVTNNNNGLFSTQPAVAANGTLSYTPANNQSGTAIVSVKIHDNGGTANGGQDTSATQTFNITVNKSNTTTTLGSSPNPSFTGQTVTFTATVTSNTAVTGPPTGTVTFNDGVTPICSNVNLVSGQAQCQTSTLSAAGSPHSITAVYSGDGAFNGSTSNTVSQTVKPVLNLTVNDTGDTSDANLNDGICADINNKCTLRAAIEQTNFASSDDTIGFNLPANSTITLNTALPAIAGNLVINGPGANTLTVQRSTAGGTPNFGIFTINGGKTVSISGLTISNGNASIGGGIQNQGALTLTGCTISGNSVNGINTIGGGIVNGTTSGTTTLTITNSTISGNSANGGNNSGGGIVNSTGSGTATVTITNSTMSGNSANGSGSFGGGIYNSALGGTATVTITNSTMSGNSANGSGGGIYIAGSGTVTVKLSNTIVAGNTKSNGTTPDDINGTVDPSSSFNLIGTGGSGGLTNGVNNNQVGVADARLAALAFNGGTTQTMALLPGSPALDAGSNTLATNAGLTTDQRGTGFNRIVDSSDADATATVDIGAFEAQPSIDAIPDKTTNEDTALPSFNFGVADGGVSNFTVTATSGNTTLVPNANITLGGAGSVRSLSITPAANQFGTALISVTASGTIGATPVSMTSTFTLTVNSVNDAPSFTPGSNQTVNEDAGAQSVAWATNILAGPANESSQTLNFIVTNNNNALFSTQPAISPTGVLTYTPAANANGVATISVTLHDDGGTANGGVDSSPTVQFTITVNAVNDPPVNTVPGPQNTSRNTDLTFSAANLNQISIADVDAGNNNPVKVTLTATNGKLTLPTKAGLSFSVGNGNGNTTMTFTGIIPDINNALNGLVFSPTPGFDGAASVQITTDDQGFTGSGGAQTDTDTVNITVNKGGTLVFSSSTYSVSEGAGSIVITVNRTGGSSGTTKVDFATSNGTATAGADYTATSGTLTFGNGETSKTFSVPILEDQLNEANETINLTLSNAQGSGDLGSPSTAVITIQDNDPQPSLSINDVSKAEGNSGTTDFTFTVTLSAVSGQTVSVNYATADGTATLANNDYQSASGTLTYAPGETTKTVTVKVVGDTATEPDETFTVNLSSAVNASFSKATGTGTIVNDDAPAIQFSASSYTVAEDAGRATITVNRLGDASQPATVDYATSDQSGLNNCSQITGFASQRCDYAITIGKLRFAAGESSKQILIPIVDDAYMEGPEVFTLTLSNPSGGVLQGSSAVTITITDNDLVNGSNPLDQDAFFVRQLYIDFLDREPDPAGLQGWLNILHGVNSPQCVLPTDCDRIAVALGFVRSPEFTDRGYFIYRLYKTLPDATNSTFGRIPHYSEFITDMAKVSGFLSAQDLNAAKDAFITEFMNRAEFKTKYDPTINDPASYVDGLLQVVNLPQHPSRNTWVAGLTNGTLTRGQVLRQLVESAEVNSRFKNEAFVIMNYFGFLRRDADAAFANWIQIFNNTDDDRLIINGFLNSAEFRQRFAQ